MSTKFILIGGFPKKAIDGGKAFCVELIKGFSEPAKILDCIYARPLEDWNQIFQNDKEFFSKNLPGRSFDIELADPKKFIEQIKWADAIYLRGGDSQQLLKLLTQSKGWLDELDGKTLAGTSAGADAISKYYYGLDDLKMHEGLGLLPIKVIVHWCSDYNAPNINWEKTHQELKNYKDDLPIITLAEGEFKVF